MSHTDVIIAGAAAAFTIDLIVYPLDTVKTRIQSSTEWPGGRRALFKGAYQGVGSIILATLPSSATFFLTYNFLVKNISEAILPGDDSQKPQALQSAIHSASSAVAEIASCAILTPAEVIKQNAQVVSPTSRATTSSSIVALRMLLKQPRSLFRGYTALVSRNLPFTAMQFPMYEEIRRRIYAYRGIDHPLLSEIGITTAISAGSAGAVAAAVTTPLDVIKTRMMLLRKDGRHSSSGMVETAKSVIKTEGARAIWRGGLLRSVWTALGSGLYLGTFESTKVYLSRRREAREGNNP
ncbi:Mitoferrin-2 [Dactylellina cionopaga]|nr:Mitoferrin-2 [Dactylellina cionopaga]